MKLTIHQNTLAVLATLSWNNQVYAFAPISSRAVVSKTAIAQSTIAVKEDVGVTSVEAPTSDQSPKAWECDEDANCVQIDACDEEQCRTTLDVRIHGEWYDLSGMFSKWQDCCTDGDIEHQLTFFHDLH